MGSLIWKRKTCKEWMAWKLVIWMQSSTELKKEVRNFWQSVVSVTEFPFNLASGFDPFF